MFNNLNLFIASDYLEAKSRQLEPVFSDLESPLQRIKRQQVRHIGRMVQYYGEWMINTEIANGIPDHEAVVGFQVWGTGFFLLTKYVDGGMT